MPISRHRAGDAKPTKDNTREFAGLPIVVEWDEGEIRHGKTEEGKEWERIMMAPYGYIKDTVGAGDKEGVDVYLGANENAPNVYVIEQLKDDGSFDEYKSMLGFDTEDEAVDMYCKHYPKSWRDERLGTVETFPIQEFKEAVQANRGKTAAKKKTFPKGTATPETCDFYRCFLMPDGSVIASEADEHRRERGLWLRDDVVRLAAADMFEIFSPPTEQQREEMARLAKEAGGHITWEIHRLDHGRNGNRGSIGEFLRTLDKIYGKVKTAGDIGDDVSQMWQQDPNAFDITSAITEEDKDFIEQLGNQVIDEKEVGGYDLALIESTIIPDFYQIGMQRHGLSMADPGQQMQKQPHDAMKPGWRQIIADMQTVIDGWLAEYGKLYTASHNPEKTAQYVRLLTRLGYRIEEDTLELAGMELSVPYIAGKRTKTSHWLLAHDFHQSVGWLLPDGSFQPLMKGESHREGAARIGISTDPLDMTEAFQSGAVRVIGSRHVEFEFSEPNQATMSLILDFILTQRSGSETIKFDWFKPHRSYQEFYDVEEAVQWLENPRASVFASWLLKADSPQLSPHIRDEFEQGTNGWALQDDRRKGEFGQEMPDIKPMLESGEAVNDPYDLGVPRGAGTPHHGALHKDYKALKALHDIHDSIKWNPDRAGEIENPRRVEKYMKEQRATLQRLYDGLKPFLNTRRARELYKWAGDALHKSDAMYHNEGEVLEALNYQESALMNLHEALWEVAGKKGIQLPMNADEREFYGKKDAKRGEKAYAVELYENRWYYFFMTGSHFLSTDPEALSKVVLHGPFMSKEEVKAGLLNDAQYQGGGFIAARHDLMPMPVTDILEKLVPQAVAPQLKMFATKKHSPQIVEMGDKQFYYLIWYDEDRQDMTELKRLDKSKMYGPFKSVPEATNALRKKFPNFGYSGYYSLLTRQKFDRLDDIWKTTIIRLVMEASAPQLEMFAAEDVPGYVYLLHFDQPFHHARHYLGWASNLNARVEHHRKGTSGVRLMEAVRDAGIGFEVARTWNNVTKKFERRLKNQGGLSRHCPICKDQGLICPSRAREKAFDGGTLEVCDLKTAGLRGTLEYHRQGDSLWIDMFALRPEDRGKGGGRTAWQEFESSIPKDIKVIRLFAGDTGSGLSVGFWEKMGFEFVYADESGTEYDQYMWKGVNGNPTPKPLDTPDEEHGYDIHTSALSLKHDPALDAFMADYRQGTWANPINPRERVLAEDAIMEVRPFDGRIHLSFIRAVEKGQGGGSKGLDFLCALADKHGVEMDLEPEKVGQGLSNAELKKWYQSRGFKSQRGAVMVRVPKVLKTSGRRYSAQEVVDHFLSVHPTRGDEFAIHEIEKYPAWELKLVSTENMGCKLQPGDEPELSNYYATLKTPFPPVILDGEGHLIDGMHRCEAAGIRGDTEIWAYVPVARKNRSRVGSIEFLPQVTAVKPFSEELSAVLKFSHWILLAVDYTEMFKQMLAVAPSLKPDVNREVDWAKTVLKKNDRITWYLRWVRLFLENAVGERAGGFIEDEKEKQRVDQMAQMLKKDIVSYNSKAKTQISEANVSAFDLRLLKSKLEHFFSLQDREIENFQLGFETPEQAISGLEEVEAKIIERVESEKRTVNEPNQEGDEPFMKFGDGWVWWFLNRAYCSEEARAMGHCGNEPREGSGDRIISLRQPIVKGGKKVWSPHLTFVIDDRGFLGEMKGRGNAKPVAKYHPYIISLLKDPRIKGTKGATWWPEKNFKLSDLTDEQRQEIYAANPAFADPAKYWKEHGMEEGKVTAVAERLGIEVEKFKPEWQAFILRQWDDVEDCVRDIGNGEAYEAVEWATMDEEGRLRQTRRERGDIDIDDSEKVSENIVKKCADNTTRNMLEALRREEPEILNEFKTEIRAAALKYGGNADWDWKDLDDHSFADLLYYVERATGFNTSVWANIKTAYERAMANDRNWSLVNDLEYEITSGMYERDTVFTELRFGDNDSFSWDAKPVYEIIKWNNAEELANPENEHSEKERDLSNGGPLEIYISGDYYDQDHEESESPFEILDVMYRYGSPPENDERQLHMFKPNEPVAPEITPEEEEAQDDAALEENEPEPVEGD